MIADPDFGSRVYSIRKWLVSCNHSSVRSRPGLDVDRWLQDGQKLGGQHPLEGESPAEHLCALAATAQLIDRRAGADRGAPHRFVDGDRWHARIVAQHATGAER